MAQRFRSKVDAWFIVVIVAVPVVIGGSFFVGSSRLPMGALLISVGILVLALGLPLWLLASTWYAIDGKMLVVTCGPVTQRIPLDQITSITPTRSALSAPALSLDRLRIEFGQRRWVVISPREKVEFLRAMAAAGVSAANR